MNEFNKHNQLKSNGKGSLINRGCFQPACEEKAAPLTPLIQSFQLRAYVCPL